MGGPVRFEIVEGLQAVTENRQSWDELAARRPSPFLTEAWFSTWAEVYPEKRWLCALLWDDATLVAGAALRKVPGGLASAADPLGPEWDAVARDETARQRLWQGIAGVKANRLYLAGMRDQSDELAVAHRALRDAGYGVLPSVREAPSPYVVLPDSFEELLGSRSRNARQQLRRWGRDLDRAGTVVFRTSRSGQEVEDDFETFLRVEASGWKGRSGTAILARPDAARFYRSFVSAAGARGWIRLHVLELDGAPIAATLVSVLGREGYFMKTAFDESHAGLAPGSVLLAEALRSAIAEGLQGFDLLGRDDRYKMRWTDQLRPRRRFRVIRGPGGIAAERAWDKAIWPSLVALRDRAREDAQLREYLERAQQLLERSRRS